MTADDQCSRSHGDAHDARNDRSIAFRTDDRRYEAFDDMFGIMKDRHRRYALYYLADRSTADLDALFDYIVAQEADRSERSDRRKLIRRLRIEFHHRHLPMLADAGLVEYDERSETLTYRGRSPVFERLLRTARRTDPGVNE